MTVSFPPYPVKRTQVSKSTTQDLNGIVTGPANFSKVVKKKVLELLNLHFPKLLLRMGSKKQPLDLMIRNSKN